MSGLGDGISAHIARIYGTVFGVAACIIFFLGFVAGAMMT
jgi:hypothetical protein